MKVLVMDCDEVFKIIDEIVCDNYQITDIPLSENGGLLKYDHEVERIMTKVLMIAAGRVDEISDFSGVKPSYIATLTKARNLDWLMELNWYEIKVDLSNRTLLVLVNS